MRDRGGDQFEANSVQAHLHKYPRVARSRKVWIELLSDCAGGV